MIYDFAIVGSGVSGGRIAHHLTAGGARCILLEAGRAFEPKTFPRHELDYSCQMFWGGGLEFSDDAKLGFLRGKCVGGTSVVNQALLDRFDELAWDDWKTRTGIEFFNPLAMAKHYDAVESELSLSEIPEQHYNRNTRIFTQGFDKSGFGWKPLRRAQTDCKLDKGTDCIVCLGGCPRESKQSALVTTIRSALKRGLHLESEFEVNSIEYGKSESRVFGIQNGTRREFRAANVVLASGSLGNSAILFRSQMERRLPSLGSNFTCHPQFMTYAFFDEPVDAHKGAFQAVKSEDPRLRRGGFKLENVFAPPAATAMLIPGFGKQHHETMLRYRYMASMEVALRDENTGRISLGKGGKLRISKSLTRIDRQKAKQGLHLVEEIFQKTGAKKIVPCTQGFGLHLMGGCPIGSDPEVSVVNPEFQAHEHPGLYMADSSIFPAAPGINPSLTIMALSHRASEVMLRGK